MPIDSPAEELPQEHPDMFTVAKQAAIQAEFQTGKREETVEEAEHHVAIRFARMIAGFTLIIAGAAAIILPGPGWLMIVLGLSLLPFAWAQRTIKLIRRRIPGIPEEGRVPTRSLVVMGSMLITTVVISTLFGNDLLQWIRDFGNPGTLFG